MGFVEKFEDECRLEQMIGYMADFMVDATDFSWQGVKAAHAVMCCKLERGTLTWDDSRQNQEGSCPKQSNQTTGDRGKMTWQNTIGFANFFRLIAVCATKTLRSVVGFRYICSVCLQQGKRGNGGRVVALSFPTSESW